MKGCGVMNIDLRSRNMEVTPALREYVEKKIGKLEKYFDQMNKADVHVLLNVERGRHIIEVTTMMHGRLIRGQESSTDMYASVDLVFEKLEKQIIKYKDRLMRRRSHEASAVDAAFAPPSVLQSEEKFEVVRTKSFDFKPMDVEEAILQMDMLGHDFFVFANAKNEKINVVYKRKNGHYGLIEPNF